jgi:hypothetical protein
MDPDRARAIAERWHCVDREEDGTPLLLHVQRVARSTPADARALAWLHELLEWTSIDECELLAEGLTSEELRALRLLKRRTDSRSTTAYLGHLRLIAVAAGDSGRIARAIKLADLEDRTRHPHVRLDGWSPPYALALRILRKCAAPVPLPEATHGWAALSQGKGVALRAH